MVYLSGRVMTWHILLKSTPPLVSFCLGATCNTLTSPQYLACWKFEDDIDYISSLCGKEEASVTHLLASYKRCCKVGDKLCYNAVLRLSAHEMQVMINQVKKEVR